MVTIKDSKKIWPKAFYDNGGGSFGFVQANKLQTGVVSANLQIGTGGPLLSGGTGQIIAGTGSNQIIIAGGGITIGGNPISTGGVALEGQYTWPDLTGGLGLNPGDDLYDSNVIPHNLGFVPAIQCFIQDFPSNILFPADDPVPAGWRPWNNQNVVTDSGTVRIFEFDAPFGYSDSLMFNANSFSPGGDPHAATGCYVLHASLDDTNLYISYNARGCNPLVTFPETLPSVPITFTYVLYDTPIAL